MPININEFELVVEPPGTERPGNDSRTESEQQPPRPAKARDIDKLQLRHYQRLARLRAD